MAQSGLQIPKPYEQVMVYNATTVTTGNVSASVRNHYNCTIAGMTADRDFNLPTPSAAGERIGLLILDGDDAYELIIKANSVEITRVFIAEEYMTFVSTGTGAGDWVVEVDGRVPCVGKGSRQAVQSINHNTSTKVLLDNSDIDVGDIVDVTTNDRINIRRGGTYYVLIFTTSEGLDDQEYIQCRLDKNASGIILQHLNWMSTTLTNVIGRAQISDVISLSAGDYLELYTKHFEGAAQNTGTGADSPYIFVLEIL